MAWQEAIVLLLIMAGTHFTKKFELIIEILPYKNNVALGNEIMILSGHNFAHVQIIQLLWHVQMCHKIESSNLKHKYF